MNYDEADDAHLSPKAKPDSSDVCQSYKENIRRYGYSDYDACAYTESYTDEEFGELIGLGDFIQSSAVAENISENSGSNGIPDKNP